ARPDGQARGPARRPRAQGRLLQGPRPRRGRLHDAGGGGRPARRAPPAHAAPRARTRRPRHHRPPQGPRRALPGRLTSGRGEGAPAGAPSPRGVGPVAPRSELHRLDLEELLEAVLAVLAAVAALLVAAERGVRV